MTTKLRLLPTDVVDRVKALPWRVAPIEGLVALWLYGSFARDEATPISDVDLAFLMADKLHGEDLTRKETELFGATEQTLQTDEFALVNLRTASLALG
ncbi:MAG: hypothetical protein C3F12_00985 [Candidatus Methylomirabilota bacterium]|nr:nucleotidyltransferase domain-containing protein [Candidatus Methylomirabilis sp.]NJD68047.1 nucleotidyltransferase domain-containing protein [candidate division NC10 bacterium]PWB48690.1 MAG: hypothetical protein C3F12_00985 [candidate division NC10 bacterium]